MQQQLAHNEQLPVNAESGVPEPVNDGRLDDIFAADDVQNDDRQPMLTYLKLLATRVAEETYSHVDGSLSQLERNLNSLIGQKSVEMNMLAKLCSMNCDQLTTYYTNVLNNQDGIVLLERIDLQEAAELVLRSRMITVVFREAQEFEEHFIKTKSKIPRTFFARGIVELSSVKKAMIYVLH